MSDSAYQPPSPTGPAWTPSGPTGPRAGFWRRAGAYLLDVVIISAFGIVFGIAQAISDGLGVVVGIVWFAGGLAYFVYFEGSESGQTVGKRVLGIRVIDFSTGGPIGYGRAIVRLVGRYISSFVCYLGYLWMLWDREKQTWHDKLANDVVVPTDSYPVARWP